MKIKAEFQTLDEAEIAARAIKNSGIVVKNINLRSKVYHTDRNDTQFVNQLFMPTAAATSMNYAGNSNISGVGMNDALGMGVMTGLISSNDFSENSEIQQTFLIVACESEFENTVVQQILSNGGTGILRG